MEREAGSSGLQGEKAIAKRCQKSQKAVVGDKAEEPWTHPSESALRTQGGGRDPVLTTVVGHRLQSEHVVDTTRTVQNSGLMGAIFAPLGDTWQYLET